MGVHGLWRLLDSFGVVVQPDELRGKRVAIDASIWIAQFRARVAPGDDLEHRVLEGFLARILKLLYYGIRPVFVFDSATSFSKDAELRRRRMQRARNERALLKRKARQILMAQVSTGKLKVDDLRAVLSRSSLPENDTVVLERVSGAATPPAAISAEKEASVPDMLPRGNATSHALGATSSAHSSSAIRSGKRPRDAPEKMLPLSRLHHHRPPRRLKKRRLAPDAVSASITQSFLNDVECLLEERTRHEARVLHNALQRTSTSLFMGPRCAVDESVEDVPSALASRDLQPPSTNHTAAVVLVAEEDSQTSEANYVVVSDNEGDVDVLSSLCCTATSIESEKGSDMEGVVFVDTPGGSGCADAAEENVRLSSSARLLSSSSAMLQSRDLTRFLNASPSPTCKLPPDQVSPTIVVEETSLPVASSMSAALSVSSDEESATDPGGGGSSRGTSRAFLKDGSPEEKDGVTDNASDTEGEVKFTWQPYTQRLHPTQLLDQQVQEGESRPRASSPRAVQEITVSCLTPPRACSAMLGQEDDDDDYTPVKAGEEFSRWGAAPPPPPPPPAVVLIASSSTDQKGNATIPLTAPCVSNTPKGVVSRGAAGEPLHRSAESHHASNGLSSKTDGIHHGFSGTARTQKAVVPFELLKVVELLDCCGLPFVLSPAEADAQCAFLTRCGLVDAVFTEDSDVVVHGATRVLRGFFAHSKNVVAYEQAKLAACGITKTVLVALASLLGCDYTEGVSGIGLVGALKAIVVSWTREKGAEVGTTSSSAVLRVLRRWAQLVERPPHSWQEADDNMTSQQFALLQECMVHWRSVLQRANFPEAHAVEAFFDAEVDLDTTPFDWLPPDWHRIRVFAGSLGALNSPWLVQKYELARKACMRCDAEAAKAPASLISGQRSLTEYGVQKRVRETWVYQKQPTKHATVLAQLRAVQRMQ
ncbi:hypothetical protein JKF63_01359 [Porcisia hertigi]|uniref:DNA repair protein RAD2 n=1 Tax=Porcisia hertigi TaxID=2761500 RepID=A0A836HHI4_9TRYP|nr:hypothetical protein JKF63_01359 [Porcisia hertigi]